MRRLQVYPRFVSLAGWRQVMMGEPNVLLPIAEVAELLDVDRSSVSRCRRWVKEDGYLVEVKQAAHRATGKSEATEFRSKRCAFRSA